MTPPDLRSTARPAHAERFDELVAHRMTAGSALVGAYDRRRKGFVTEPGGRLLRRAAALALRLRRDGIDGAVPVFVGCPAPIDAWTGYLAVVLAGGLPAIGPVRPAFDGRAAAVRRIEEMVGALGPDARVLTSAAGLPLLGDVHAADALVVDDEPADEVTDLREMPAPEAIGVRGGDPDAPVHLQFTSGSTGRPKVVAISHRNLLANSAVVADVLGTSNGGTLVSWLPLYHDMGLVAGAVASFVHDVDLLLQSPFDFVGDPTSWLRAVSDHRATTTLAPNLGFEAVVDRVDGAELRRIGIDLSRWTAAACGGEPPRAATLAAFARKLAPFGFDARALSPGYGLAEATVAVTGTPVGMPARRLVVAGADLGALGAVDVRHELDLDGTTVELADGLIEVCSSGPLHPDVGVQLVGPGGDVITEDDRCGEIVVSGTSVAVGVRAADGTIERFDSSALRTGDVGFVHDGWLYVVERLKNVIVRHGRNHAAAVLEGVLASAVGISPERVVVLDTDLEPGAGALVAVVEDDRRVEPASVVRLAREHMDRMPLPLDEIIVVASGALPRTTSGKKRHVDLRRALRGDELRVLDRARVAPASRPGQPAGPAPRAPRGAAPGAGGAVDGDLDVRATIIGIVGELAAERGPGIEVGEASRLADDLLLDSVAVYELALEVEEAVAVALDEAALAEVVTVDDLCRLVESARGDGPGGAPGDGTPGGAGGLRGAVERFHTSMPHVLLTVDEQRGRQVLVDGRWFDDFASCNYLGLDLHPAVIEAVAPMVRRWGVHPSWTRAVASPEPYRRLERALAELVGSEETVVFPTVSLLHLGVLPRLAGRGAVLVDGAAHHSTREAAALARARGARVRTWAHGDLAELERQLGDEREAAARIVVVDGVYSMSGGHADVRSLARLAERYDARVYVDDAHGFGVLGRDPSDAAPYGIGGGGVLRHAGVDLERFVYVGGLSKAMSSMAAFVSTTAATRTTFDLASTVVFSGPVPVASLASSLAALETSEQEGEVLRARLAALTEMLVDGARGLGFDLGDHSGFPIVNVVVGAPPEVRRACRIMWDGSVLVTPSVFPAAPLEGGGVRFTVTAANTEAEVDRALAALARVREALPAAAPGA